MNKKIYQFIYTFPLSRHIMFCYGGIVCLFLMNKRDKIYKSIKQFLMSI